LSFEFNFHYIVIIIVVVVTEGSTSRKSAIKCQNVARSTTATEKKNNKEFFDQLNSVLSELNVTGAEYVC
jgi:hypothetical protein